jgi:hypothetical protein
LPNRAGTTPLYSLNAPSLFPLPGKSISKITHIDGQGRLAPSATAGLPMMIGRYRPPRQRVRASRPNRCGIGLGCVQTDRAALTGPRVATRGYACDASPRLSLFAASEKRRTHRPKPQLRDRGTVFIHT